MHWTQLILKLPGGLELTLVSAFRPRKTRPSTPPPVITEGHTIVDNVIHLPTRAA